MDARSSGCLVAASLPAAGVVQGSCASGHLGTRTEVFHSQREGLLGLGRMAVLQGTLPGSVLTPSAWRTVACTVANTLDLT